MKLGIMQPYFFPYLGYFDLINYTDRWILFDTAQYIRHGWVNRNRILHPAKSWQYIIVPLQKHSRSTPICQTVTAGTDWKQRILGQLSHYKRRAPFYVETHDLVRKCLDTSELSLARIDGHCLQEVCGYLDVQIRLDYLSELELDLGDVQEPGDWALAITRALGYETYVNPIGGRAIFKADKFTRSGVALQLRPFEHLQYACGDYTFEPGLSIIDVLMWNSPAAVRDYLGRQASECPADVA